ncbi:nuclear transport factor 2 family protein [candidate division KSB1 bacterium]|nr:nuclear transport factor 2 family protein [candidate division KSB1 bacterium]
MKRITLLLLIIFIFSFGMNCVRIDELKDAELEVRETMDSFYQVVEKKDLEGILSFYLLRPGTVMLGTGAEDRCLGSEEIEKKWSEILADVESIDIFKSDETIQISSDLRNGWVTSVNRVEEKNNEGLLNYTLFFSAVLEKRAGNWVFRQMHFSIPQEDVKMSAPVEIEPDSVINEMNLKVKKLERDTTVLKTNPDSIKTDVETEAKDY